VAVARRLLAPDPMARFGSASEAHDALAVTLAAEILRGGPQPAQRLAELVQRQPAQSADREPSAAGATEASETQAAVATAVPSPRGRRALVLGAAAATLAGALALLRSGRGGPELSASPPADRSTLASGRTDRQPAIGRSVQAARPASAPDLADRAAAIASNRVAGPAPARPGRVFAAADPKKPAAARLRITAPPSWVTVYLDGQKLADDAGEFDIPSGRHRLRVENPPMRLFP
jgi:hypothetical protein